MRGLALALGVTRPRRGVRHDRGAEWQPAGRLGRAGQDGLAGGQPDPDRARPRARWAQPRADRQPGSGPSGRGAVLAAAPRAVYQVILPKDPSHGFIVVYDSRTRPARRRRRRKSRPTWRPARGGSRRRSGRSRHPPGRVDGHRLQLAAAGCDRRHGAGDPGGARDARGRVPGRELGRRSAAGLVRRRAAGRPPRPTPGPARA